MLSPIRKIANLGALVALVTSSVAHASDRSAMLDCYDAVVIGSITTQIPSVIAEPDDGSIVMRWPWFVDLNISQVPVGNVASGTLTVLTLQHTYARNDLGERRWFLRRNSRGGYNAEMVSRESNLDQCAADAPLARSFIDADAATLMTMRNEGEQHYRPRP